MDSVPPPDLSVCSDEEKEIGIIREEADRVEVKKSEELSWVSVAQEKKRLKKHDVEVKNKDGKQIVEIPDSILASPTPLWEDFVVGKFLDLAPHVAKVHMVLNKIWKYGDEAAKVEVYEVNDMVMRFKVPNPKIREKIVRRGMWNIVGVPMIVSEWTPTSEEEKKEDDAIPMWVHLEKVPLHMFSWEALSFITSAVGYPVKLHPETVSCTNLDVAKVFVKVDVSKVLPKEITFAKEGKEFTVKFYYPWLPSRCDKCDKWGHVGNVCGVRSKKQSPKQRKEEEIRMEEKVEKEGIDQLQMEGDKEVEKMEAERDKEEMEKVDESWSLVTPTKTGRTQTPILQKNIEKIVISASKFSVLHVEEEEEGEILEEEGKNLEEEVYEVAVQTTEEDLLEDSLLEQQEKEKTKGITKRGRKAQKPKAQDANPKSIRSSRHQH